MPLYRASDFEQLSPVSLEQKHRAIATDSGSLQVLSLESAAVEIAAFERWSLSCSLVAFFANLLTTFTPGYRHDALGLKELEFFEIRK